MCRPWMRVRVRGLTALRHHQPSVRLVMAQDRTARPATKETTMTREQALQEAAEAAAAAKKLAFEAQRAAHHSGDPQRYAVAGAVWADTSRAYTALAASLPATDTETEVG